MIKALSLMLLFSFLLSVSKANAANTSNASNEDLRTRENISEKARSRLYEGGADEQPLAVQQSLAEPRTDGSESILQRKLLNSEDGESESNDETSSGF